MNRGGDFMRRKMLLFYLAYYVLCLPIYVGVFLILTGALLCLTGLGGMSYVDNLLLVATPIIVVMLTRFSPLKRYIDPFAAAEVLLAIYILTRLFSWKMRIFDLFVPFHGISDADEIIGWLLFLFMLFVISLMASFSFARKKGENSSFRVLSKFRL